MKTIFYTFICLLVYTSCSTDEEQSEVQIQEETILEYTASSSLRATLAEMRNQFLDGDNGRVANELCFNFEYPIDVSYNDGSEVTVTDFDNLLELLLDETLALHIVTIAFPINVILADESVQTINNESEFQTLIDACGYDVITLDEVLALVDDCFTVNYPITLVVNDVEQTFNSEQEIEEYFITNASTIEVVTFAFPLSVTLVSDGSTNTINDDFELIDLITNTCGID